MNLFRRHHAAAGAIDPQHDGLHVVIEPRLTNEPRGGCAADGAGRLIAIEDLARGHDYADLRRAGALDLLLRAHDANVVVRRDGVERAALLVLADECR